MIISEFLGLEDIYLSTIIYYPYFCKICNHAHDFFLFSLEFFRSIILQARRLEAW